LHLESSFSSSASLDIKLWALTDAIVVYIRKGSSWKRIG
jgi:hypothetical protein